MSRGALSCEYVMDVGRVWHLLLLPVAAAEPSAAAEAQPPLSRSRATNPGLVRGEGIILGGAWLGAPVLRRRREEGYGKQSGGTDGWTDLILWLLLRLRCFAFHGNNK